MHKVSTPIKTALASYGMSGQLFHAPFLHVNPHYDFAYVLERTKKKCNDRFHEVISLDTWQEIIQSDAELVIVNTPTYLHFSMAKEALLVGKHVVIEKPVCSSVAEMEELINIAEAKNLVLNVYHNMRLEGEVKTAKKLIDEGALGDIIGFEAYFDRYRPEQSPKIWKETPHLGAGLVYDIGSHLIDQLLTFFGSPQEITSEIKIERSTASVPDFFNIQFNYPTFKAIIGAGMLVKNPRPKLTVRGTKATYTYLDFDPQEAQLKEEILPNDANFGMDSPEHYGVLTQEDGSSSVVVTEKGTYMDYYENLAEVLLNKHTNVLVTNKEAKQVIEVIEKVYEQNGFSLEGNKN